MGVEVSKITQDVICQANIKVLKVNSDSEMEPLYIQVCTESSPSVSIKCDHKSVLPISQHIYFRIPYEPSSTTTASITALNLIIYWDLPPTDTATGFSIIHRQKIKVNTNDNLVYNFGEINLGNLYHPKYDLSQSSLSMRKRHNTVNGFVLIAFMVFNVVMIVGVFLRTISFCYYNSKNKKEFRHYLTIQQEEKGEQK